jgi:hypothetical protein
MILQVSSIAATVDEPLEIRATGLTPGERITLRLSLLEPYLPWQSEAEFIADGAGVVDLSSHSSAGGFYEIADPMGLFWSMRLPPATHAQLIKGEIAADPRWTVDRDAHMSLSAESNDGESVETELVRRHLIAGVKRTPVREQGLVGTCSAIQDNAARQ